MNLKIAGDIYSGKAGESHFIYFIFRPYFYSLQLITVIFITKHIHLLNINLIFCSTYDIDRLKTDSDKFVLLRSSYKYVMKVDRFSHSRNKIKYKQCDLETPISIF